MLRAFPVRFPFRFCRRASRGVALASASVFLFAHLSVFFVDGYAAVLVFRQLFRIGDRLFLRVEQFDRPFAFGELDLPLAVLAARHVVIFHRGFCLRLPVGGLFFIFFRLFLGLLRFNGVAFRFFGKFAPFFGHGVPALPVYRRGGFILCLRNGFVFGCANQYEKRCRANSGGGKPDCA